MSSQNQTLETCEDTDGEILYIPAEPKVTKDPDTKMEYVLKTDSQIEVVKFKVPSGMVRDLEQGLKVEFQIPYHVIENLVADKLKARFIDELWEMHSEEFLDRHGTILM